MRFVLRDLADTERQLLVDWDQWRALLEALFRSGVLDRDSVNRLVWRFGGEGTWIPAREAHLIAEHIDSSLLPTAGTDGLRVDSIAFDAVETPTITFHEPGTREPIILKREWLQTVADFCTRSGALHARQEGV